MKMAESMYSRLIVPFSAFLLAFFATGSCTAQIPFLLWSTESLPPLAQPAAGHIVSSDELSGYLSSALGSGSHTVLLFLQKKLSKDDFTVFGGVYGNKEDSAFQNLEAALQSSPSSVTFPALEWQGSFAITALLQEKLGVSPLLVDVDTLSHLTIDQSVSNLLLISLPYCTDFEKPCKEVLLDNDEVIGRVVSNIKAKGVPYTAIYTGLQPSRVIPETFISNQPAGRTLLQAAESDVKAPIWYNISTGPCIMLWAQNLSVSLAPSSWVDLAAQNVTLGGSNCEGTNSRLVLNYQSGYTLSFIMSQKFYPGSARNWSTLDTVQLQFGSATATFTGNRSIHTPAEYSYHCQSVNSFQDPLLVMVNSTGNASEWRLNFVDFQIQGFGLDNSGDFSYASDCAGFFSAGIWMGLLTTLIFLLIFVYGLQMIVNLNTMDRFDDPKGPTISVPQSE